MKKFRFSFLLLLSVVLATFSCKKSETENNDKPGAQSIEVSVSGNSLEHIQVEVNCSDDLGDELYFVGIAPKSELESAGGDSQKILDAMVESLGSESLDLSKVDNRYVFNGGVSFNIAEEWKLEVGTKYTVAAIVLNENGEATKLCDTEDVSILGGGAEPFTIDIKEITAYSAIVDVDLNEDMYKGNFYLYSVPADVIINTFNSDFTRFAENVVDIDLANNVDITKVDNNVIFDADAKDVDLSRGSRFNGGRQYYVVAFGVNESGSVVTDVINQSFKTKEYDPEAQVAIEVLSTSPNSIKVKTTPGASTGNYAMMPVEVSSFNSVCQGDKYIMADLVIYTYLSSGIDITNVDNYYIFSGEQEVNFSESWTLKVDTDYIICAFATDQMGRVLSEVVTVETATEAIEDVSGELNSISISDITVSDATATVDAGGYNGIYYLAAFSKDKFESTYNSDYDALAEALIQTEKEAGTNFSTIDEMYTFFGDAKAQLGGILGAWYIEEDTEYVVLAFGISQYGEIISDVIHTEFRTLKGGDLPDEFIFPDAEFGEIAISEIGSDDFIYTVTPNDKDMLYNVFYIPASEYDKMDAVGVLNHDMEYFQNLAAFYELSLVDIIDVMAWKGDISNLNDDEVGSNTEYVCYAYGWDIVTMQPLTKICEARFTTLATPAGISPKSAICSKDSRLSVLREKTSKERTSELKPSATLQVNNSQRPSSALR